MPNKKKLRLFAIIKDMIRFIKKWWLLEKLRKEIIRHTIKQSVETLSTGRKVLLSQFFLFLTTPENNIRNSQD